MILLDTDIRGRLLRLCLDRDRAPPGLASPLEAAALFPRGVALPAALKDIIITDDIVVAAATQNTNAGVIRFDCYYMPLSSNGALN